MFGKPKDKELKPWKLVFLLLVIAVAGVYRLYQMVWPKAWVTIGGEKVHVLVADNYARRLEGWSNKNDMGKYGGMLFVFPYTGQHTIVMRDMRFPLDIVWISGDKVVDIAPNLPPEPNRAEDELTPYFASKPSNMVLELPAGFREKTGLAVGDTVILQR